MPRDADRAMATDGPWKSIVWFGVSFLLAGASVLGVIALSEMSSSTPASYAGELDAYVDAVLGDDHAAAAVLLCPEAGDLAGSASAWRQARESTFDAMGGEPKFVGRLLGRQGRASLRLITADGRDTVFHLRQEWRGDQALFCPESGKYLLGSER